MNSDHPYSTSIPEGTNVPNEETAQSTSPTQGQEPQATAVAPSATEAPNTQRSSSEDEPQATAVAPSATNVPSSTLGSGTGSDSNNSYSTEGTGAQGTTGASDQGPYSTAVPPSSTAVSPNQTATPAGTAAAASTFSGSGSQNRTSSSSSSSSSSSFSSSSSSSSSSRSSGNKSEAPTLAEYVINGNRFKVVRLLSRHSGESKVFLVENGGNKYALKLYHGVRHPNHQILDIVSGLSGSNLVVDIFDHGVWRSDEGRNYDYELMRYYSGRSLAAISFRGKEEQLKKLVPRMAAAIDYCHRHNILHRDIKPANFIFTDESESNLVLMDFGIGKLMDDQRRTTTDDGRTPLYAAPEMYTYIPGRPTYVSTPSDYFALGMSLLALWEGEGVITADEGKLLRDKQEETLPYPTDMSEHMLSLIKALTRRNPDTRANFDAIVRWCNGETIYRDQRVDRVNSDFRIVFSADENLIAHSPKELGQLMWRKKELATRYLYQDMISRWLNDAERPELAVRIEEITEHLYPQDRESGLYAACLFLNPEMGFESGNGNFIHNKEQMAKELWDNKDRYFNRLSSPSHRVWTFLRHIGEGELADKYPNIIRSRGEDGYRTLCYALSASIPYYFADSRGNSFIIKNIAELQKHLRQNSINQNNIEVLASPSFRVWIGRQDPNVINKLLQKITARDSASKIGWITAYLTNPNLDYNFKEIQRLDQSDCFTIEQLCGKIAQQISNPTKYGNELANQWQASYFNSSRLCQYLLSKGKYDNQVQYIYQQLGVNSVDNTPRYGHYNQRVIRMKAVAGLLDGKFPLELKGKVLKELRDYETNKNSFKSLTQEEDDLLTDWLALSFSENPKADYSRTPYQGLVKNMISFMTTNCPNSRVANKVKAYHKNLDDARKTYKRTERGVKLMHWAAILLCFIPMLGIFGTSIYVMLTADDAVFISFMESVGTIAGWIIGVLIGLWAISEAGLIVGLIVGILAGCITKALCVWAAPVVPWVWVALLAVIIFLFAKKIFTKIPIKLEDKWSTMPMSQAESLGEMAEAFGHRSKLLPNLPGDYPMCVYNQSVADAKSKTKKLMTSTLIMLVVTIVVIALSVYVNKSYRHYAATDHTETTVTPGDVAGYYEGTVNGTHATMVLTQTDNPTTTVIKGKVVTDYSNVLEHNLVGQFTSMDKKHMVLKVVNGDGMGDELRKYNTTVEYGDDGTVTLSGNYDNQRKKTNHTFTFTRKE